MLILPEASFQGLAPWRWLRNGNTYPKTASAVRICCFGFFFAALRGLRLARGMNIIPAFSAVDRLTPPRHLISFVLNFPSSSTLQGAKVIRQALMQRGACSSTQPRSNGQPSCDTFASPTELMHGITRPWPTSSTDIGSGDGKA